METKPSNVYLSLYSEKEYYGESAPQYIPSYDEIVNVPFHKGVDYRNDFQVFQKTSQAIPEEKEAQETYKTSCQKPKINVKCSGTGKIKYVVISILFIIVVVLTVCIKLYLVKPPAPGPMTMADMVPSKEPWYVGVKYTKEWVNAASKYCDKRKKIDTIRICCNNYFHTSNCTCNDLTSCMTYINSINEKKYDFLFDENVNIYEGSNWPCSFLNNELWFANIGNDVCKHDYSLEDDFFKNINKLIKFIDKKHALKDDFKYIDYEVHIGGCEKDD